MTQEKYSSKFKAKAALAAIKEETTIQIASGFGIYPGRVRPWTREFLKNAPLVFDKNKSEEKSFKKQLDTPYKKNGVYIVVAHAGRFHAIMRNHWTGTVKKCNYGAFQTSWTRSFA